ncbi:MAG: hypothetical protein ACUVV0_15465, partial [Anaerolineae bacterium]
FAFDKNLSLRYHYLKAQAVALEVVYLTMKEMRILVSTTTISITTTSSVLRGTWRLGRYRRCR